MRIEYKDLSQIEYKNSYTVKSKSLVCGFCGNMIAPVNGYKIQYHDTAGLIKTAGFIYECPYCKKPIFYDELANEVYPGEIFGRNINNLPAEVASLYEECRKAFSAKCYTGAILLARKLLMHIGVENGGETNKNFVYYVNYLDEKGYIPPNGKAWIDYIRQSANEANHEIVIKTREDAIKVLTFISYLLIFDYELPNSL